MGQKVYDETDLRLKGWKLVDYIASYTNGVSSAIWLNRRGEKVRVLVY